MFAILYKLLIFSNLKINIKKTLKNIIILKYILYFCKTITGGALIELKTFYYSIRADSTPN